MSRLEIAGAFALLGVMTFSAIGLGLMLTGGAPAATPGTDVAAAVTPNSSGVGGCPSSNAIGNFQETSVVGASVEKGATTWTYFFSSFVNGGTSGVPGLIQYCVYPNGSLPNSMTVSAVGADGSSFTTVMGTHQGYFGFGRATGNPSNLPMDGTQDVTMGTATWTSGAPAGQTILLHINDGSVCMALYGGWSNTCFVYPHGWLNAPCGGAPACKSATIDEATSTNPLTVPANTVLHVHYTITIVNQPSNGFDMEFLPLAVTQGTSWTGLKDAFTCFQVLDPNGTPGANGAYPNYQGSGLDLRVFTGNPAPGCLLPRIQMNVSSTAVVLHPGDSITITIDMTTTGGLVANGGPEHGLYCLNKGVDVRWFESDDQMIHNYHSPDVDITVA